MVVASEACDDGGLEARKDVMISDHSVHYKREIIAKQINMFYIYLTHPTHQ